MAITTHQNEPIAIVGSACRFSGGASSPSKLWSLLRNPRDVRSVIPNSRFNAENYYHPDPAYHGHSNVRHSYVLDEDVTAFDTEFFGIKPVEAKAIDPQQRLLMETVYEGLESAGLTIDALRGSDTGVYVGLMCGDYEASLLRDPKTAPVYAATGIGRSILSNRVSYFFDWHGPSMTLDTACSSSLVAVHLAVQSLRAGESRIALACGSNLLLGPENYIMESKLKMLSPDGRSKMWDKDANGYARGDGVAACVLKTLSAAIEDGDDIECIIRETGFNQDGATTGITMPSAAAQQALIRATYAKAGLDLEKASDRPQFFEAHGTGTPAGDPIEAEAISRAFYGKDFGTKATDDRLYVGSIKTILGHTEGTAGLAALLKASLALQHSTVPPNMLLNNLSDRVAPFTANLEIPSTAKQWPQVVPGQPRRASVNSFGFGGANAHAILESYERPQLIEDGIQNQFTPFVFSALTRQSLRASLSAYADYIQENPSLNLRDLAYTLQQRRSEFPYRISFAAASADDLVAKIRGELEATKAEDLGVRLPAPSGGKKPKVLGIFTGQGAQYARMGAELIEKSATARKIVQDLQAHIEQLPEEIRPDFSLEKELRAAANTSRVLTGAFSFLSTVVQIVLVDLLKLAGVHFDAIVAHSSGEMAAAYAAGHLSARDAMCVAYFRGRFASKMESPNGPHIKGAMLAAGMSPEDAQALVEDELFAGRLCVAAVNSSSSVTISGDEDAIDEVKTILDDENKFNRKLRVDRAYHSNHVSRRLADYVALVKSAGVRAIEPTSNNCLWISSVYGREVTADMNLSDEYWGASVARSVHFYQALKLALEGGEYQAAIEVGPHPALKGPASQTIQEVLGKSIPYYGVLNRGSDAAVSLASSLGSLWCHLGGQNLDLTGFDLAVNDDQSTLHVVKSLPSYKWNHEASYRHESRASKKHRSQLQQFNQLLGTMKPESAAHHLSWGHLLRASEIDWVSGHQVQNQTVFPAAGYICTAFEGARVLAGERDVRIFELKNFVIHQALTFSQDDAGIEVQTSLSDVRQLSDNHVQAKFTYSASLGEEDLALVAEADLHIIFGKSLETTLPRRATKPAHMITVDNERFYNLLATLGYGFEGPFKSLHTLRRKLGTSVCAVKSVSRDTFGPPLLVHPAELDGGIQSLILAYSYPDDDQLLNMHLPTSMSSIRVNPALCKSMTDITVDSTLGSTKSAGFSGDVSIYTNDSNCAAIQMQRVELVPLGALTAKDDRKVFSKYQWVKNSLDGELAASDTTVTKHHSEILEGLERISTYYLKKLDAEVPGDSPLRSKDSPHSHYLQYARHIVSLIRNGEHKVAKKEWLKDSLEDLRAATEQFSDLIDYRMMHLVGQQMPRVFRGETNMLEEMRVSNILDNYYQGAFGSREAGFWIGKIIAQLAERYPHLNILEVGAGTGGATTRILQNLDSRFLSYTFTDVSSGFFEGAAETFSAHKDRMVFKTFDCGQDPVAQGYAEGTCDVVVAFLVIHATPDLELTMRNIRKLLKPGGFLIVGEGTNNGQPYGSAGFIFGSLPGWWLGADTGRPLSPFVSYSEWERLLRSSGFSGIDATAPQSFQDILGMTVFAAQAVDDQVSFLREPVKPEVLQGSAAVEYPIKKLVVIGGSTPKTQSLIRPVQSILKNTSHELHSFNKLTEIDFDLIDADTTVVSLSELDKPVFEDMTPDEWLAFKTLFSAPIKLLWVTSGRLNEDPWSNMTVGFARTAVFEAPALQFQNIDIADLNSFKPGSLVEKILRFDASASSGKHLPWPLEPEIVVNAEGEELVPRLRHIKARNDRYNSARRPITKEADIYKAPAALHKETEGWKLTELSRWASPADTKSQISLEISHAVLSALRTPHGHQFLVMGTEPESQARFLALVPSLLSVIHVPKASAVPLPVSTLADADLLTVLAARLVAMAVVDPLIDGDTVVVHNSTELLARTIASQAASKNVRAFFVADSTQENVPVSWTKLEPYLTQSEVSDILPLDTASFVGLSSEHSEIESNIMSSLPSHCRKESRATLYSSIGWESSLSSAPFLGQFLQRALVSVQTEAGKISQAVSRTVSIDDLLNEPSPEEPTTIIDWTLSKTYPVHVSRLDSVSFFKGDKTYWLCGLSGALGVSLADWMIERGARYLVLTSRNPNISPDWIKAHKRNGVIVSIVRCDVTNEPALRAAHQSICETMPQIIGVLNGAMVLRDVSIRNMSFELMSEVFRPKVYGSIHLDRIFKNANLDFFILFSSINCVIGNLGQANYAAANTFMCSLAAQRRKRGLAATALNVGAIIGAGYMERESSKALDLTVSKMALMHLSEQDYHQLFAEGIDAGRPDSGDEAELTTGLLDIPAADTENAPKWHSNPAFFDFVVHRVEKNGNDAGNEVVTSVQDQLAGCKSTSDVLAVVKGRFAMQLRNVLQMNTADEDLMAMRSRDIGLDSLISVDIRSWFLKNFEVSVPVLKIMGNDTMAELADLVAAQVPASLLPGLGGGESPADEPPAMNNASQPAPAVAPNDETSSSADSNQDATSTESSSGYTGTSTPASLEATTVPLSKGPIRIDWKAEIALPQAANIDTSVAPAARPRTIVLTGVSGLLGRHLLLRLLQDPSVKEIVCLATRRLDERLQSKELVEDSRIQYFPGDLEDPRLGLSEQQAAQIFSRADAVIHNGADTSHLKFYPEIKAANMGSTKELIRLCTARKVPIHYLSTVGVALFGNYTSFPEVSVAAHPPPVDGSHGYVAAKWASERLLEEYNKQHGVNVWIHRPSTIIREGADAESAAAQTDWMNALAAYMRKTRAVPSLKNLRGALDFVSVHNATKSILTAVFGNKPKASSAGVSYTHQVGDIVIPLDNLKEFAIKETGAAHVDVLPVEEWSARAVAVGLNRGVAALIDSMDDPGQPHYPRMLRGE
ncbi:putative polyketide synthase [Aspergillus brunneoviolaceus CBS 621.78]|uniref:Polyketide synthase n=1 Tax=Aspergillus brunneoviolaceus CBS 621.78 TaxID=1450534 RepID=A0ACD1FW23_9EURO|nr:putative polyketide synthase [Aspergillus brunneoviolaceus CBS 621.78]RAH41218.1 putative polyketide synthase [Aspergillus brunneoviolaceus CBS 621.78]